MLFRGCAAFKLINWRPVRLPPLFETTASKSSLSYTLRLSVTKHLGTELTAMLTCVTFTSWPVISDNWNLAKNYKSSTDAPNLCWLPHYHWHRRTLPWPVPWRKCPQQYAECYCLLPPGLLWAAASHQAHTIMSPSGFLWIQTLWPFMPLAWSNKRFARLMMSMLLLLTSEKRKQQPYLSSHVCGSLLHHPAAPS